MQKILVVNNDLDTMRLLKSWLEIKGYKVKYTSNANESLSIAKNFKPGVIILDILQNSVLKILRANNLTSKIPVLLMTGYTLRQHNHQLPVDDIIEKPFDLPILERKIKDLVNK